MADIIVNSSATGAAKFIDYSSCLVKNTDTDRLDKVKTREAFKEVLHKKMDENGFKVFNDEAVAKIFGVSKDEARIWMYTADSHNSLNVTVDNGDDNGLCTEDEFFNDVFSNDLNTDKELNGVVTGVMRDDLKKEAASHTLITPEKLATFVEKMPPSKPATTAKEIAAAKKSPFTVNKDAKGDAVYLEYSANKKTFEKNITAVNTDAITAAELQAMISGLTSEQANAMIANGDGLKAGKTEGSIVKSEKAKDQKLSADELRLLVNTADAVDGNDGKVSFKNFQTIAPGAAEAKKDDQKELGSGDKAKGTETIAKDGDNTVKTTTTAAPVKEDFFSFNHSESGDGFLGGNTGLLALAGFAIFAGIGLSGGFGGGVSTRRSSYYGYGGYC